MTDNPNAADLLYGARAIAEFLGLPEKVARHRIDAGTIPTFKMGEKERGTICARRSSLRAWLAQLEAAAAAEAAEKARWEGEGGQPGSDRHG